MKIYINTSNENVEIGGEIFIPGEWLHLSDTFKVDTKKYPFIKSPNVILAEKYASIQGKDLMIRIKEQHLDQFAMGIKEAETLYKTASDPIASEILTKVMENSYSGDK